MLATILTALIYVIYQLTTSESASIALADDDPAAFRAAQNEAPFSSCPGLSPSAVTYTENLAAAAGPSGQFTLYSSPGSNGLPNRDSGLYLRACAPELSYANYPSVMVHRDLSQQGPSSKPPNTRTNTFSGELGANTVIRDSTAGPDSPTDTVTTVHQPNEDLRLIQRLAIDTDAKSSLHPATRERANPRNDALHVTYEARNTSNKPIIFYLRQTLSPPANRTESPAYLTLQNGSDSGLTPLESESTLKKADAATGLVMAPRGVHSGMWASPGRPPSQISFGNPASMYTTTFGWGSGNGSPLADNAIFSVYWNAVRLDPKESETIEHYYAPATPPDTQTAGLTPHKSSPG